MGGGAENGELLELVGSVDGQILAVDRLVRDVVGDEEDFGFEDGGVDSDDETGLGELVEAEVGDGFVLLVEMLDDLGPVLGELLAERLGEHACGGVDAETVAVGDQDDALLAQGFDEISGAHSSMTSRSGGEIGVCTGSRGGTGGTSLKALVLRGCSGVSWSDRVYRLGFGPKLLTSKGCTGCTDSGGRYLAKGSPKSARA